MGDLNYAAIVSTPVGKLGIRTSSSRLQTIDFLPGHARQKPAMNETAAEVLRQLACYFENPWFQFTVDCDLSGTVYQQRVWTQLQTIKPGQYLTYSDMAQALHSGPRAVGGACRANPVPIIVPCHRVVSKSGIGGYDGDWGSGRVDIKQWLLKHESGI